MLETFTADAGAKCLRLHDGGLMSYRPHLPVVGLIYSNLHAVVIVLCGAQFDIAAVYYGRWVGPGERAGLGHAIMRSVLTVADACRTRVASGRLDAAHFSEERS